MIPHLFVLAFPKYHVVHNALYLLFEYPITCYTRAMVSFRVL
jgi:hypothetical protein